MAARLDRASSAEGMCWLSGRCCDAVGWQAEFEGFQEDYGEFGWREES